MLAKVLVHHRLSKMIDDSVTRKQNISPQIFLYW